MVVAVASDEQLIAAAREGEKTAFKELVRRYQRRVAGTVIGMLGRCPEADDVGQETFIRFYRALDSFRGDSTLGSYLTRIAINLSLNELKRRKRRSSLFSSSDDESMPEAADEREGRLSYEDKQVIHWALGKLSPDYRAVVVLRLLEGYSTKETADILKVPLGTVLSRLSRAQKQMRKTLAPYYGDEI